MMPLISLSLPISRPVGYAYGGDIRLCALGQQVRVAFFAYRLDLSVCTSGQPDRIRHQYRVIT